MVKYVPNRQVKRIFPYDFYNDLYTNLTQFVAENKHFLYRDTNLDQLVDRNTPEVQFENFRKLMYEPSIGEISMEEHNLYKVDQGEFLILDQFISREDRLTFIKEEDDVDRYVILVQLYDDDHKPLLSKDRSLRELREIESATIHDDNLAILVMQTLSAETPDELDEKLHLGVIKAPPHLIEKLLTSDNVERSDTDV